MCESITQHDNRAKYCPRLGHEVPFSYCRLPGSDVPCRRTIDCWRETFDVEDFVRRHFTDEQIRRMLAPPQDKMTTLMELIEKARQSQNTPE